MTTRSLLPMVAAVMFTGQVSAQQTRPREDRSRELERTPRVFTFSSSDDDKRPRIGVTTGPGGKRDTLGLLVTDVTRDGPAAKAGIEDGDRLQSVNGVNLRLSAADVDDEETMGLATRRLIRELGKVDVGTEVELKVYREGQSRTVKVKTASLEDLQPQRMTVTTVRRDADERASLGIGLGSTGSKRDTMGVLIASVTDDSPADKAHIEEGDRIAAINGVDLRVNREDAGDASVSSSRLRRLTREMEKVKAGDEVELRLSRSGQQRTVRVKTVPAKDLPRGAGRSFFIGDGAFGFGDGAHFNFETPSGGGAVRIRPRSPGAGGDPMMFLDEPGGSDAQLRLSPERRAEIEGRLGEMLRRVDPQIRLRARIQLNDGVQDADGTSPG